MTKNTDNRQLYVSGIMNTLNSLSVKLEQLAGKKKALTELPDTTTLGKVLAAHKQAVKNLTEEAKKIKVQIEKEIKCLDVFEAASVVTTLCISPDGADDAYRQKMARRRASLKSILAKTFPEFDFRNDKIGNRAVITPVLIGNEYVRQANSMLATVTALQDLGYALPAIDRDKLAENLQERAGHTTIFEDKVIEDNTPSVADVVSGISSIIEGAKTIDQVAKEEKGKKGKVA